MPSMCTKFIPLNKVLITAGSIFPWTNIQGLQADQGVVDVASECGNQEIKVEFHFVIQCMDIGLDNNVGNTSTNWPVYHIFC